MRWETSIALWVAVAAAYSKIQQLQSLSKHMRVAVWDFLVAKLRPIPGWYDPYTFLAPVKLLKQLAPQWITSNYFRYCHLCTPEVAIQSIPRTRVCIFIRESSHHSPPKTPRRHLIPMLGENTSSVSKARVFQILIECRGKDFNF